MKEVHLSININPDLKQAFKVACAANGTTMKDEVLCFVKKYIASKSKKKGKK